MNKKINEIGRSMVEMMGYMAVAMSVIIAIGKIVTSVFNEHKYSQATIQLGDLATAISKAGAMEKDYSEVSFNQYIPESYRVVGEKIFHVFGGEVSVGVLSDRDKDKFSITFYGLKRRQCIELGMKDWRHNQSVDLYAEGINGTFLYWPVYSADEDGHTYSGATDAENGGFNTNENDERSLPMKRAVIAGTDENDNGLCDRELGNVVTWVFN